MSRYHSGRAKEWWLLNELKQDPDCLCAVRSSRSLGPFDIVACMAIETWFIQVKGHTKITPDERAALERLCYAGVQRMSWVVFVFKETCIWQGYLWCDSIHGEKGWYEFENGPLEPPTGRVLLRRKKC